MGRMSQLLARSLTVVAVLLTTTGCGGFMSEVDQVRDPLTPEQAKTQVIDAARAAVSVLGIHATESWVTLVSCNDQGDAPFRGQAAVHFPAAPTVQSAKQDAEQFLDLLRKAGWTPNPKFHSSAPNVEKDGVTIILEAQGVGASARILTVLGQCRDVTTTKQARGGPEQFSVAG